MTGSRMLRLGEAMSILARRTRLPSGNSPVFMRMKEVEIFFDGAVAIGAVLAGLGEGAAMLADLVGGEVVDVSLAGFDELEGPLVELAGSSRRRSRGAPSRSRASGRLS